MWVLVLQNVPYELQSILVIKVENNVYDLFTIFHFLTSSSIQWMKSYIIIGATYYVELNLFLSIHQKRKKYVKRGFH